MKRMRAAQKNLCEGTSRKYLSAIIPLLSQPFSSYLIAALSKRLTAYRALHRAMSPALVPVQHLERYFWGQSVSYIFVTRFMVRSGH